MTPNRKITGVDLSPRAKIFRVIDNQLRTDPKLKSVVKTFRSWSGGPEDKIEPALSASPWLRLSIGAGPTRFIAASTIEGTLFINAELWVAGSCIDDLDTLWGLIERACYSDDVTRQQTFETNLRAAGAWPALVDFAQPAYEGYPEGDGHSEGRGVLSIKYKFDMRRKAPGL